MKAAPEAVVHVEEFAPRYNWGAVTESLSFTVKAGEVVRIVGGNGVGKSSVLKSLIGVANYDGTVRVLGRKPPKHGYCAVARGVLYVAQEASLPPYFTVQDYLAAVDAVEYVKESDQAKEILSRLKINHVKRLHHLSHGQQRLVEIVPFSRSDAPLLLLDEPFAGLADEMIASLLSNLERRQSKGFTTLVVEHRVEKLSDLANRTIRVASAKSKGSP